MIDINHLPHLAVFIAGIVVALVIGAYLYRRGSNRLPAERLSLFLCPVSILVTLTSAIHGIAKTPANDWNGARLVPTVGLFYGARMYVGPDGPGAIMNTIYPPLSYLVYIPAALFSRPTYAITAGSLISAVLFFAPAILLGYSPQRDEVGGRFSLMGIAAVVAFFQIMLNSKATNFAAFFIHADAPMLGFLGFACLALYRNGVEATLTRSTCLISAIFAAMALWSKQTAMPMIAALPVWVLLTFGLQTAFRYLAYLAVSIAALSVLFFSIFGVDLLLFNTFSIPSKHPWIYRGPDIGPGLAILSAEYFTAVAALLASILLTLFARRQMTPDLDSIGEKSGLHHWFAKNPWSLFSLMAVVAIPTSFLSRIKIGGYWNNYAPTPYFLAMSLVALSLEWYSTNRRRKLHSVNAFLTLIGFVLVHSPFTRGEEGFSAINAVRSPSLNSQEEVYRYSMRHPGTAYFPWNPLSTLFAEGKFYHFEYGMFDRELAGYPVSQDHFRRHLPERLRYVCFPPTYKGMAEWFERSMRYLPEFRRRVEIEELPGWTCYER